jgi:hypothetical protein
MYIPYILINIPINIPHNYIYIYIPIYYTMIPIGFISPLISSSMFPQSFPAQERLARLSATESPIGRQLASRGDTGRGTGRDGLVVSKYPWDLHGIYMGFTWDNP